MIPDLFSPENFKSFDGFIATLDITEAEKDKLKREQRYPGIRNTLEQVQKLKNAGADHEASVLLENLLHDLRDIS